MGSAARQIVVGRLRNELCAFQSLRQQAQVGTHLHLWHSGLVYGFVGALDGHPSLVMKPVVALTRSPKDQAARGTRDNPAAHVMPSIVVESYGLLDYFAKEKAKQEIRRIQGLVLLAPSKFEEMDGFPVAPVALNQLDSRVEGHRGNPNGSRQAMLDTIAEVPVGEGTWDGSGKPVHSANQLVEMVHESMIVYKKRLLVVHQNVLAELTRELKEDLPDDKAAKKTIQVEMLSARIEQIYQDRSDPREIVKPIMKSIEGGDAGQRWSKPDEAGS
jgi:hypothetical protein